jgi:osmotically-inducible protein OsmY
MADENRWRESDNRNRERRGERRDYGSQRSREASHSDYREGANRYGQDDYTQDYRRGEYGRGYGGEREYGTGEYEREYGRRDYSLDFGREDYAQGYEYGSRQREPYGGYGYGRHGRGTPGGYGSSSGSGRSDYGSYGPESYGRSSYGQGVSGRDRGWWDRASDEVSSWFGDEDAERRRRMDELREGRHSGRGPKGYTRSDERIREDVCDRLSDDPWVDASDIEVTVSNCEVTLAGNVDSREARRRAEDTAERISGVKHVQNNLRVQQQSPASSDKIGTSGMTLDTTTTVGKPGATRTSE